MFEIWPPGFHAFGLQAGRGGDVHDPPVAVSASRVNAIAAASAREGTPR